MNKIYNSNLNVDISEYLIYHMKCDESMTCTIFIYNAYYHIKYN